MNADVKTLWVEALRSGRFRQGNGRLCLTGYDDDDERLYCCLGVLCALAVEADVVSSVNWGDRLAYGREHELSYLPFEVREWASLDEASPRVRVFDGSASGNSVITLSYLNDVGTPFDEVARLIEEQL